MAYYHDLITEKSWEKLQELKRRYRFILIGGWAVYLYTKGLKSRDIDFICDYEELEKLKRTFDLVKNERLKKYEIHMGEFDVDIYTPFFSEFLIPIPELQTMRRSLRGCVVLEPEPLLFLKQKAFEDRAGSAKGEKDRLDIISLLKDAVDLKKYERLAEQYRLQRYLEQLRNIVQETRSVPELGLSEHAFARFKKNLF